jgi:flagellin
LQIEYFVTVGNDGIIRTSNNGNIWEFVSSPVNTNLNKVIYADGKFIALGDYGIIIRSINRNSYEVISNNLGVPNIVNICYNYGFYIIVTAIGDLYYSFDLSNWIYRSTSQANFINDLVFVDNLGSDGRYVAIGSGATAIYAEPIYNRATLFLM